MPPQIPLADSAAPPIAALPALPTMSDLPSEDPEEPGLPDEFHDLQPQLLSRTLRLSDYSSQEIYTASDLNLYYDLDHPLWHKRPDWFLVVGVPRLYGGESDRASYVIWQEKVSPVVIVEFLSPGTEGDDLGRFAPKQLSVEPEPNAPPSKFEVYEQILKVPHYVVFNKRDRNLRYFRLIGGGYQEQTIAKTNPRLWIADLKVGLALWHGIFEGMPKSWLRWCDAEGTLLLTDTEAALQEKAVAQQRQQQAETQRQQAELQMRRTVLSLHEMGMSIAQISQITGFTETEVAAIVAHGTG